MSGHKQSVAGLELKERYKAIPEILSPLDGRRLELPAEQLAAEGKLTELKKLKDHSKLRRKSHHGFTLLHHASTENRAEIVEFLVTKGCDIDEGDDTEQSALHKAAMFGHAEFVKVLLDNGVNVNKRDSNGNTPLHAAIINGGDVKTIELLITKADPRIKNNKGRNALHVAVQYHKIDTIKLILNHPQIYEISADPDDEGYTPLLLAVSLGHFDTTEELLNRQDLGVEISAITKKGKSIIHLAAITHNENLLAHILEIPNALYIINNRDIMTHTPLHDAAEHGRLKQVIKLLDRGGLVVSTKDGYSPLHYACFRGHLNVATKLLKRHPFQKDLITKNGDTALHLAATSGYPAIIKLLLDNGVSITHNVQQASFLDIAMFRRDNFVAMVAVKHERWQECLDLISPIHPAPMIHLIHTLPDVAKAVMDHSITSAQLHPNDPGYWKNYDFKYISNQAESTCTFHHDHNRKCYQLIFCHIYLLFTVRYQNNANPLIVINEILQYDRNDLLVHPLLLNFLNLKWRKYGRAYIQIRTGLLALLTILLSALVAFSDPPRPSMSDVTDSNPNATSEINDSNQTVEEKSCGFCFDSDDGVPDGLEGITLIVNLVYIIVIVGQIISYIRQRKAYVNVVHWFHTLTEICTVVFTAIFIISNPTIWLAAIPALLCAWLALNLFTRSFDVFGLYPIMFYDLLIRITKALFVGLYYVIGFGLIMYILIGEEVGYNNPILSIYNTFFAAFRGFNFFLLERKETAWQEGIDSFEYRKTTYIVVLVLTVVLTIALSSLLIGIAVGSIGNIEKEALLYQAKLRIRLFLELDPHIPKFLERIMIIPESYKIKGSVSMTDKAYNLWNFFVSKFAPPLKHSGHTEIKQKHEDNKQKDMHYRIKAMERQIETVIKHQKLLMEQLSKK
ncbi:transient receptor potential cation channel subfamily A member 1-like [Dysidea avara]|uniref:transient receptor potential cation channel subfamily A member 1-like n=1 Tax=Dysidea avara TaxID=196820 RepID=UPI00333376BF